MRKNKNVPPFVMSESELKNLMLPKNQMKPEKSKANSAPDWLLALMILVVVVGVAVLIALAMALTGGLL